MNIIPKPNQVIVDEKKIGINVTNKFNYPKDKEYLFEDFDLFVKKAIGINNNGVDIYIKEDSTLKQEGYLLQLMGNKIEIAANSDAGIFYATQTLKQILLQGENGIIPSVRVKDEPRFKLRGFMLDSGRYFYPVKDVKHYIDMMVALKLNFFHWHLTEDQGWRVEIKKYPLLTKKGSKRSHTNFGLIPHSGFYTKEDLRDIVDYCHKRFVKIMPEFDIPGHSVAAISCYPYLACHERKLKVATHWGVKHDILCAGKEETYKFVFDIIDELCEIFKDDYFHIGGDEAVKMRWKLCPDCQAAIKREGLKNEEELQQFFMNKVNRYLNKKGYTSMVWNWDGVDEISQLDSNIVWQLCGPISPKFIKDALERDVKMLVASSEAYYLDFPYGITSLKKSYEFNPMPKGANGKKENILGIEAPLWTEYVPSVKRGDFLTVPRIAAIAENGWSAEKDKNYEEFEKRIETFFVLARLEGLKGATLKQANPNIVIGKCSKMWFGRRIFHWQGLHNLIDDAIVAKKLKKKAKKKK